MAKKSKKYSKKINIVIAFIILLIIWIIFNSTFTKSLATNIKTKAEQIAVQIRDEINSTMHEDTSDKSKSIYTNLGDLKVFFIDVGQADSILIVEDNEAMLIDAGNNDDGKEVVEFIKNEGIEQIKYAIGTHAHEDHIGGLDDVIDSIEIDNLLMPETQTNTKTYEDVIDSAGEKELEIKNPKKEEKFSVGDAICEIMTDEIKDKKNLNESSIIIRMTYGNESFLFMGDAEVENEATRQWPETDVLKVGHHGSNTSSSERFLKQVNPKIAIIMVGKNNTYKLPKDIILERIQKLGTTIYRTDIDGNILISSDGNSIEVFTKYEK